MTPPQSEEHGVLPPRAAAVSCSRVLLKRNHRFAWFFAAGSSGNTALKTACGTPTTKRGANKIRKNCRLRWDWKKRIPLLHTKNPKPGAPQIPPASQFSLWRNQARGEELGSPSEAGTSLLKTAGFTPASLTAAFAPERHRQEILVAEDGKGHITELRFKTKEPFP